MRAYSIEEFIGPSGLRRREEAEPTPGPLEVVIRLRASSLNFRDGMILNGFFGEWVRPGIVPLSDGAGEVVRVGERVTRCKPGDRVMPIFNQAWIGGKRPRESMLGLGGDTDGTLRDFIMVKEDGVTPIPDHLSYTEAAALPCAAVTAWCALVQDYPLYPGETVVTLGTGGVSIFALQFAKLFGARVISTTSSDVKAERLRALGADEVINYNATPEWDREVMRLTDNAGADLIVEVGGAGTLPKSFGCAHADTRIAIVGLLAGASGGEGFNFMSWLAKTYRTGTGSREHFEEMNRAISFHQLRPVVDRVFGFDEAPGAFEYLAAQKHFGKVVISHEA
jgi:NADPH:quinone reductase-like Zn-dependent oxidoreductase